jgi:glucosylceramidase
MKGKVTTTIFPENNKIILEENIYFEKDQGIEKSAVNLHPEMQFQEFEGFGGAFSDSAGYVYSRMNEKDRKTVMSTYFGREQMGYRLGRMHIDSCDFSVEQYEAMSDETDRQMKSFSIERTKKYIIPMVLDAQKELGQNVELMITPWSPPAFMKTNEERSHGGKLKDGYEEFWADYICKYIEALRDEKLTVSRLSIQNEPAATQTWDSCVFTAEEERRFLQNYLYPAMERHGLNGIEIFIWDHNKERLYERACEIITEETERMITGLAFHWYSGDHFEALDLVRRRFPDKKLILSEACIEYSIYDSTDYLTNAQKYAHDIIGNLNNGMNAFYDWNLILDEKGGPNHVENLCDAPYLYDISKKELLERNTLAYIRHFSHYIKPGAKRIGFSRYTTKLDVTAFKNPDGTLVCVLMNADAEEREIYLRLDGCVAKVMLKEQSISTVEI